MSFKSDIYENYVTHHNKSLYGEVTIDSIEQQFPVWDYIYTKYLPKDREVSLLDIGCGEGAFVYYLHQKGYDTTSGIDISQEQIEIGKKLGIKNICRADLFSWLKDNEDKYDLIIARDVLEHFSKPEIFNILKLSYAALKEHGKILIQVPNGEGIWHQKIFYGDFTHETLFSSDSINQIFLSTGFSNVHSYSLEFPVRSFKSWLRKIAWRCLVFHQKFRRWIATGLWSGILTPNILAVAEK